MLKCHPESTKSTPSGARISDNFQLSPKGCSGELTENGKGDENSFKSKIIAHCSFREIHYPHLVGQGKTAAPGIKLITAISHRNPQI